MVPKVGKKIGRPIKGQEVMNYQVKVRLEPGLSQRLEAASQITHKSKPDLIREAIRLYLQKLEEYIGKNYY